MYEIEYTQQAIDDLRFLRKRDQQEILSGIEVQLSYRDRQPTLSHHQLLAKLGLS